MKPNQSGLQLQQHGIKCDAEGCDYKIAIEAEEYVDYLNKPCPKCGANLLTEEDHMRMQAMLMAIELANETPMDSLSLPPEVQALIDSMDNPDEPVSMTVGFDKDGNIMMQTDSEEVNKIIAEFTKSMLQAAEENE